MSHALPSRRHVRAFTLIELLTVIAIIGILAAILIPTVSKVRTTAKNAQCVAKMRDWGRIILLYANDNKGTYRQKDWGAATNSDPYYPYFNKSSYSTKEMRWCPADPKFPERQAKPDDTTLKRCTFAMALPYINGTTTKAPDTKIPLSRATSPSTLLLMTDGKENDNDALSMDQFDTYVKPLLEPTSTDTEYSNYINRHPSGKVNALFGDGSVSKITYRGTDRYSYIKMKTVWFQLN